MLLQFKTLQDRDNWFASYPEISSLVFVETTGELFIWKNRWIKLLPSSSGVGTAPPEVAVPNTELRFTPLNLVLQLEDTLFATLPKHTKVVESFGYLDVGFEYRPLKVIEQIGTTLYFNCRNPEYVGLPVHIMVSSGGQSPIRFINSIEDVSEDSCAVGQLFVYNRSMFVYAVVSDYAFDLQRTGWIGGLIQLSNKGVPELAQKVDALTLTSDALRTATFMPLTAVKLKALNGLLVLRSDGTFILPYTPAKGSADVLKVSIALNNIEADGSDTELRLVTAFSATYIGSKTMRLSATFASNLVGCQVIPDSYLTYDLPSYVQ